MPAWIECRECGEEFRDKAGRTKCPECGARIDDDFDDERPRRRKGKPKSRTLLFALLGVGGLAVAFAVVMLLLLLGGPRADPTKVTVANFQRLNLGMVRGDAERILAGSTSSSAADMQSEMTAAFGQQGWEAGMFAQLTTWGSGTWRRWDGPNSDLKVWALFAEPFGGGKEQLTFCTAIERLPGGGYRHHPGKQSLGGIFGGFPGFPGGQPFPPIQFPK